MKAKKRKINKNTPHQKYNYFYLINAEKLIKTYSNLIYTYFFKILFKLELKVDVLNSVKVCFAGPTPNQKKSPN